MKRTHLLKLIEAVRARVPLDTLLIVGSQSAHALDRADVPAVEASLEVDLLLPSGQFQHKTLIQEEFGEESAFFKDNGFFVHPIGIGIVSLPSGWEARLQPVRDDTGRVVARAVEIHDTLAAKIMAGREKDFDFLRQLLERGSCDFDTFLRRFLLLRSGAFGNAVLDRLSKLEARLRGWGRSDLAQIVQTTVRLPSEGGSTSGDQLRETPPAYPALSAAEEALVADLVADGLSIQDKFRPEALYKRTGQGHYDSGTVEEIRKTKGKSEIKWKQ
jgi:hypothetical protein